MCWMPTSLFKRSGDSMTSISVQAIGVCLYTTTGKEGSPVCDKVQEELKRGRDDLWDWAEQQFGANAFVDTATAAITSEYQQMLVWVMAQSQFQNTAKTEFQAVADGWLAAYAKQTGCIVVTLEQFDPNVHKRVPLPNVCRAFDVECISPFEMLRRLGVQLNWSPPR